MARQKPRFGQLRPIASLLAASCAARAGVPRRMQGSNMARNLLPSCCTDRLHGESMGKSAIRAFAAMTACASAVLLAGCNRTTYDDASGFRDGFLTGYGQACQVASITVARRHWMSAGYSLGYADGQAKGTAACRDERRGNTTLTHVAAVVHAELP